MATPSTHFQTLGPLDLYQHQTAGDPAGGAGGLQERGDTFREAAQEHPLERIGPLPGLEEGGIPGVEEVRTELQRVLDQVADRDRHILQLQSNIRNLEDTHKLRLYRTLSQVHDRVDRDVALIHSQREISENVRTAEAHWRKECDALHNQLQERRRRNFTDVRTSGGASSSSSQ